MKISFAFLVVIAIASAAHGTTPARFAVGFAGVYEGKEYRIDISDQIATLPNWTPGSGEPKLSLNAAWKVARTGLAKLVPDVTMYETTAISLERLGSGPDARYLYVVKFIDYDSTSFIERRDESAPNQLWIWVSLDGRAFLPEPLTDAK